MIRNDISKEVYYLCSSNKDTWFTIKDIAAYYRKSPINYYKTIYKMNDEGILMISDIHTDKKDAKYKFSGKEPVWQ